MSYRLSVIPDDGQVVYVCNPVVEKCDPDWVSTQLFLKDLLMRNLTIGKPLKLIVLFTIPLLIGNLFQQLYSFMDA